MGTSADVLCISLSPICAHAPRAPSHDTQQRHTDTRPSEPRPRPAPSRPTPTLSAPRRSCSPLRRMLSPSASLSLSTSKNSHPEAHKRPLSTISLSLSVLLLPPFIPRPPFPWAHIRSIQTPPTHTVSMPPDRAQPESASPSLKPYRRSSRTRGASHSRATSTGAARRGSL